MKSTLWLWTGLGVIGALFAIMLSCQKSDQGKTTQQKQVTPRSLTASVEAPPSGAGWVPDGSKIEKAGNVLLVTAPEGWNYLGYDQDRQPISFIGSSTVKSISCSCNTKGDCNPFKASGPGGSTTGCTGDCTNCTMIQSAYMLGRMRQILEGGYYQLRAPTRILENNETAPAVFDAQVTTKAFQDSLVAFYNNAYKGKRPQKPIYNQDGSISAAKGYCLLPISIMGRAMLAIVPKSFAPPIIQQAESAKASCSCSNGSCALKDKSVLGTGAIWCAGNCSGVCTLTLNGRLPGLNLQYQLYSYAF